MEKVMEQPFVVDTTRNRAAFLKVLTITNKLNDIFRANIRIQPGFFLSEVKLLAGVTAYQFPTLTNEMDPAVFPLSTGVNQNDIFVGYQRELTVDNRTATTSTLIEPQRYFNKLIFVAANTTTPAHIEFIFNSFWNYVVGSTTFIQRQFTRMDLLQPVTQQSSANNWATYDGSKLIDIDPYMVISGKATNYLNLKINASAAFAGEGINNTVNVLSWYMLGNTLQNGAGWARFYTGDLDVDVYVKRYEKQNAANGDRGAWSPLKSEDAFGNFQ